MIVNSGLFVELSEEAESRLMKGGWEIGITSSKDALNKTPERHQQADETENKLETRSAFFRNKTHIEVHEKLRYLFASLKLLPEFRVKIQQKALTNYKNHLGTAYVLQKPCTYLTPLLRYDVSECLVILNYAKTFQRRT